MERKVTVWQLSKTAIIFKNQSAQFKWMVDSNHLPTEGLLICHNCYKCPLCLGIGKDNEILCAIVKEDPVEIISKKDSKTQRRNPPNPPKDPVFTIDPVPPSDGRPKYIGVKYQRRSHQLPVSDKFFEMARQVKDDANRWILEEHKRRPFPNPPSGLVH